MPSSQQRNIHRRGEELYKYLYAFVLILYRLYVKFVTLLYLYYAIKYVKTNKLPQVYVLSRNVKNRCFLFETFYYILVVKVSVYLNRHVL